MDHLPNNAGLLRRLLNGSGRGGGGGSDIPGERSQWTSVHACSTLQAQVCTHLTADKAPDGQP